MNNNSLIQSKGLGIVLGARLYSYQKYFILVNFQCGTSSIGILRLARYKVTCIPMQVQFKNWLVIYQHRSKTFNNEYIEIGVQVL